MVKIGTLFSKFWKKKKLDALFSPQVRQFQNFMSWVQKTKKYCGDNAEEQYGDLVRVALKPIQIKHICNAYRCRPHDTLTFILVEEWLNFKSTFKLEAYRVPCVDTTTHTLELKSDIVLPTMWHDCSIIQDLGFIGDAPPLSVFKQIHHEVTLLLPFKIGFVTCGNHTIAQGILKGNGRLVPKIVYDFTPILQDISFDGKFWVKDNIRQSKPRYPEFGWVWEAYKLFYDLPPYIEQRNP